MNNADKEYLYLAERVLSQGRVKKNRTGIDTIGVFGAQARFNLQEGFPLLTTKRVFFKGVVHELLWFLSGSTNIKYLVDNDVHIWDGNAYNHYKKTAAQYRLAADKEEQTLEWYIGKIKNLTHRTDVYGELGEGTYGGMWRAFPYEKQIGVTPDKHHPVVENGVVDQIQKLIDKLKSNPDDRRLIVSAWHPYWVDHCALPPCHCLFQFHTEELTTDERYDLWCEKYPNGARSVASLKEYFVQQHVDDSIPKRRLNCQLYQRSADLGLGIPYNIASYSLLMHMVAQCVNMAVGEFVHSFGDLHIYSNHIEQIKLQMSRAPYPNLPRLELNPDAKDIFDFKYEDIQLVGYESHPVIKMEMAV